VSVALLDVNLLIALAWPSHVHHQHAHEWFAANHTKGWATCPMTQCAFVRISSNPKIIASAVEPLQAMALLQQILALPHHQFWTDTLSFPDAAKAFASVVGHRQVSDVYLLGLALQNQGRLATLDRGMAALLPAGVAAQDRLEIISTQAN